jgi:hypothetical protein
MPLGLQQQDVTDESERCDVIRLTATKRCRHLGEGVIERHRVDDDLCARHALVFGAGHLQRADAVD